MNLDAAYLDLKMSGHVAFDEQYGSTSLERSYVYNENGSIKILEKKKENFQSLGHVFRVSLIIICLFGTSLELNVVRLGYSSINMNVREYVLKRYNVPVCRPQSLHLPSNTQTRQ